MIELPIKRPGVYDVPKAVYHSQCCDAPSASRSDLWTIRKQSAAHFWAFSDLNPNRYPDERTKTLEFGDVAHTLLLSGELPADLYALTPFRGDYASSEKGWKRDEKKAWRDEKLAAGVTIITAAMLETIERMRDVLAAHHLVRDGLFRGIKERSIFWKRDGLWLKSQPDVHPHDTILADYKSVASVAPLAVERSITDYGYHCQFAMAVDGLAETTGKKIENCAILAQEKKPPYLVQLYPLSPAFIDAGRAEYLAAFKVFKQAIETGEWRGYVEDDLNLPGWKQIQLEAEGLLGRGYTEPN